MKAPDNNLLELALCKKAILVEGDAEFILMDAMYKNSAIGACTDADGIHVISVDGTSFKRYFELAKPLGIKVAAVRDNDGDYQANCVANYADFTSASRMPTMSDIPSKFACMKTTRAFATTCFKRAARR
jgi:putative ATP-dependent endonuclease of OLD family